MMPCMAVLQPETDMVCEYLLYFRYLPQTFHTHMNGIAFFLKHLPPFSGNIVLGVVAGYKHKRDERHALCLGRFQLRQHGFKGGIAFDGPHMEVAESGAAFSI